MYLSLGVNELGYYNDEGFYQAYCDAIDAIRACQPDAVIYIQGLIPLNESVVAASGGPSYLTNEHLRVYNGLMQKAAEEKQVVFLDLYSEFANENGELPEEASKDGVHLKSDYCKQWLEYLKVHTVDFETLYPEELRHETICWDSGGTVSVLLLPLAACGGARRRRLGLTRRSPSRRWRTLEPSLRNWRSWTATLPLPSTAWETPGWSGRI